MITTYPNELINEIFKSEFRFITQNESKYRKNHAKNKYIQLTNTFTEKLTTCQTSYRDILKMLYKNIDINTIKLILDDNLFLDQIDTLRSLTFIVNDKPNIILCSFYLSGSLSIRKSLALFFLKKNNINIKIKLFVLAILCTLECKIENIFKPTMQFHRMYSGYSSLDTIINIWVKIFKTINPFNLKTLKNFCNDYNLEYYHFKSIIHLIEICDKTYGLNYVNGQLFTIDSSSTSKLIYKLIELTFFDYETYMQKDNRSGLMPCPCSKSEI